MNRFGKNGPIGTAFKLLNKPKPPPRSHLPKPPERGNAFSDERVVELYKRMQFEMALDSAFKSKARKQPVKYAEESKNLDQLISKNLDEKAIRQAINAWQQKKPGAEWMKLLNGAAEFYKPLEPIQIISNASSSGQTEFNIDTLRTQLGLVTEEVTPSKKPLLIGGLVLLAIGLMPIEWIAICATSMAGYVIFLNKDLQEAPKNADRAIDTLNTLQIPKSADGLQTLLNETLMQTDLNRPFGTDAVDELRNAVRSQQTGSFDRTALLNILDRTKVLLEKERLASEMRAEKNPDYQKALIAIALLAIALVVLPKISKWLKAKAPVEVAPLPVQQPLPTGPDPVIPPLPEAPPIATPQPQPPIIEPTPVATPQPQPPVVEPPIIVEPKAIPKPPVVKPTVIEPPVTKLPVVEPPVAEPLPVELPPPPTRGVPLNRLKDLYRR